MSWNASVRRGRKRLSKGRAGVAAALVVLLAAGIGYLVLRPRPAPRATLCVAGRGLQLTTGQAAIAATIAGVASRRDLPARAVAIAYATALQESKLANLHYGDLDSVGVFQQRPSEGWGSAKQLEDPVYATGRFFDALTAVPNYQRLPIYVAAQDVQHSADGQAYDQYATVGTALASAFTGADPHAVWCSYADPAAKPSLVAAGQAMTSAFGLIAGPGPGSGSMSVQAGSAEQGWAVAAWLVSNAATYGITSVRYQGLEWLGFTGPGRWTPQAGQAGQAASPAATSSVEFG
ncbi:MAG TPA: hypothetical protein VH520_12665 [Streptosporangiaceae bacterium]